MAVGHLTIRLYKINIRPENFRPMIFQCFGEAADLIVGQTLCPLRYAVSRKRPRFWSSGDWLLHHDNAPAHSSNLVQQFLAKHKIVQLRQPSYSPDITPCDFWMFPKLKMALKGKRFDDIETIQSNATHELKAIPKSHLVYYI